MMDPVAFRQLTAIKHQERLERYARPRRRKEAQTAATPISLKVRGAWTALLTRLSLALGR